MDYPKVMVFANQCFSQSTANGRTLGMLFHNWPKEKLCQFCIYMTDPDFDICNNYFSVSDSEALKSLLSLGLIRNSEHNNTVGNDMPQKAVRKRNRKFAITMLIRNLAWNIGFWRNDEFRRWRNNFCPQLILIQSGESAFMIKLACDTARKFGVPLVFFNTEAYYLFESKYLPKGPLDFICYPLFIWHYNKTFERALKFSDLSIYLNKKLENDYQKKIPHRSAVIYNTSNLKFIPAVDLQPIPRITYLGGLGYDRPKALAEFANVLEWINPEYKIDVYGSVPPQYCELFDSTPNLVFHGFVPYEKVKEIIYKSDILVHAETSNMEYREILTYGFSTKIADSISSGRNFVLYAPASFAFMEYCKETGAAWTASTPEELKTVISKLISDKEARAKVLTRARDIASDNHKLENNCLKFRSLLSEVAFK